MPNKNNVIKTNNFDINLGQKRLISIKKCNPIVIQGISSTCGTFQNSLYLFGDNKELKYSNLIQRTVFV